MSVLDHRRRRAFVAETLLYDKIAVPIPVPNDDADWKRWMRLGRKPERQRQLLKILGHNAQTFPWSPELRDRFPYYADAVEASERRGQVDSGPRRADVAHTIEDDSRFLERDCEWYRARHAGQDPDTWDHRVDRQILVDRVNENLDRDLVERHARAGSITAVIAYGSYRHYTTEQPQLSLDRAVGDPVMIFGWQFLVPSSSNRSDDDLLKEAVELANHREIGAWRAAFREWRAGIVATGVSEADAVARMDALMSDYKKAARRSRIKVKGRWGVGVAIAGMGAVGVIMPPIAAVGAFATLGSALVAKRRDGGVPSGLNAAAIFHEAKKRFG
jgi:hypothetical protein